MKNIVNPNPLAYPLIQPTPANADGETVLLGADDHVGWTNLPEGNGPFREGQTNTYYENPRNRFVMDAIHICTLYGIDYPRIGEDFTVVPNTPLTEDSRRFTLKDALSYAALYPANAAVFLRPDNAGRIRRGAQLNPGNPVFKGLSFKLESIGIGDSRTEALNLIAGEVYNLGGGRTHANTVTTKLAQKPSFQVGSESPGGSFDSPMPKAKFLIAKPKDVKLANIARRNNTTATTLRSLNSDWSDPGYSPIVGETEVTLPQYIAVAHLPEIIPSMSNQRILDLAKSVRITNRQELGANIFSIADSNLADPTKKSKPGIDHSSWSINAKNFRGQDMSSAFYRNVQANPPADVSRLGDLYPPPHQAYYNRTDKHWYFVQTTIAQSPQS